jgi:methionyl-tRNA formyltransferase
MRIVFCGTPEFAVPSLRLLLADPAIQIEAVVTQPDRPRGRGREVGSSAVKEFGLESGLHVYQPEKIKSESAHEFFKRVAPDAVVIIAYGQIVPQSLIEIPRLGWINLHASLLPRYRGAAPINWAILNGEARTGLTTMQIDAGMDTGPILLQKEIEIGPDETAPELVRRLSGAGAPLVVETLRKLASGDIYPVTQDSELATFARMLKKEHGRIHWTDAASKIYNMIRGLDPWPGAYTGFRGQLCHIWGSPAATSPVQAAAPGTIWTSGEGVFVACGELSALKLSFIQLEARKRITAHDFVNGVHLQPGEQFESLS